MTDRHQQPDLWTPEIKRRGVFAATSHAAGAAMPDDAKATQRSKIVDQLAAYGAQTYHQLAAATHIDLQTVCWRMKELRESGTIRFAQNADGSILKSHNRRLVELAPPMRRSA